MGTLLTTHLSEGHVSLARSRDVPRTTGLRGREELWLLQALVGTEAQALGGDPGPSLIATSFLLG